MFASPAARHYCLRRARRRGGEVIEDIVYERIRRRFQTLSARPCAAAPPSVRPPPNTHASSPPFMRSSPAHLVETPRSARLLHGEEDRRGAFRRHPFCRPAAAATPLRPGFTLLRGVLPSRRSRRCPRRRRAAAFSFSSSLVEAALPGGAFDMMRSDMLRRARPPCYATPRLRRCY